MRLNNHDKPKNNESSGKKTNKKSPVKTILWITLACLLAAGLYFGGRIAYFGFVDPRSAFDTTLHTQSPSVSPAVTAPAQTTVQATPMPTPSTVAQQDTEEPEGDIDAPEDDPANQPSLSEADLNFIKDKVNILLIGVDENPQREKTRVSFRSDVLLLLCIDFNDKNVHLLSVPRDSYTSIYNTKGKWKINAAFAFGGGIKGDGFEYAMMTVSNLLGGIPINYYAGIQMEGLKKLIDSFGGVDYNVDITVKMNGRVLKKGMQHLTGQQVLDYCRIRKGIGTDVNRVDRQQRLLLSLFTQLQQKNKLDLVPKVFEALKDDLYTNLTLEQIVALAVFANQLDTDAIRRYTLKGEYMMTNGVKYYYLDQQYKVDVIYDIFKIKVKASAKDSAEYVKAYTAATTAINSAAKLLKKYKNAFSVTEKTGISELVINVTSQRKLLPASEAALAALIKQLNSACYQAEQAVKKRAIAASASASPILAQ
jgi:LCP family protein required for cell wall assembly